MAKYEHFNIGDRIETTYGYEVIKGYNGHIVYTDSFTIEMDGSETKDETEGRFTLSEIAGLLRELDGRNHKVIIDV